jgi:hypothetical protein
MQDWAQDPFTQVANWSGPEWVLRASAGINDPRGRHVYVTAW